MRSMLYRSSATTRQLTPSSSAFLLMYSLVEVLCRLYTDPDDMDSAAFRKAMSRPFVLVPNGGFMTTVSKYPRQRLSDGRDRSHCTRSTVVISISSQFLEQTPRAAASMSKPTTCPAFKTDAAMLKMPPPQPRSATCFPVISP
uniref:Uncharacterized protein n=1 Tax=Ixodes ricinus TaxID=34613 RepID=A0A6B0UUH6_IXORI